MSGEDQPAGIRAEAPCPICGRLSTQRFHPFCSKRCADVDLNRWLSGVYAIPADGSDGEDEEEEMR